MQAAHDDMGVHLPPRGQALHRPQQREEGLLVGMDRRRQHGPVESHRPARRGGGGVARRRRGDHEVVDEEVGARREVPEEKLGLAREARGGGDGGEVEKPAHGERLEGEAEAEQVREDGPEGPRPTAALEEDERRVAQPQRDGRVPRAPRGGGRGGHREAWCAWEGGRISARYQATGRVR